MSLPGLESPFVEIFDLLIAASLVYALLVWLKDARARVALVGVGLVGASYLVTLQFGLSLTPRLLQATFVIAAVMLVLVFQEDLRRVFERVALLVLRRDHAPAPSDATAVVVRAAFELAAAKRGALVVVPGREPLDRHLEGGVPLDGRLSEALLLSLFDPHSPGHDGAVVLQGRRVTQFGAHLPLSSQFQKLGQRGTRHAAALGLSEGCDAACVVVSEETATVSLASGGHLLRTDSPAQLEAELRRLAGPGTGGEASSRGARALLRAHGARVGVALLTSLGLWMLIVPGSETTERRFEVPIEVSNLPSGYAVERVTPQTVLVSVSGLRRTLFLMQPRSLGIQIDAFLVQLGRRTFEVAPHSVSHPPDVVVNAVEPAQVVLSVRGPAPQNGPAATVSPAEPR